MSYFATVLNNISEFLGKGKISLSKKIKDSMKSAVKFINNFEQIATDIAIQNKFDYVVYGHIHQPIIKDVLNSEGEVTYLNSGDWIENLTALEYNNKKWSLYKYNDAHYQKEDIKEINEEMDVVDKSAKQLFGELIADFNFKN